jgi:hypothetical protein
MASNESMLPELDAAQLAALYLQATIGDYEKKRTRSLLHGCVCARAFSDRARA